jgi:TolB protein
MTSNYKLSYKKGKFMKNLIFLVAIFILSFSPAACRSGQPEWSPSQADLLFMSNRDGNGEIYLMPAGTEEWINLTKNPAPDNWPVWSPDRTRIAFQSRRSGNLDIWLMNADGSSQIQLTDHESHDYLPAWTPDGKQISFTSWRQEPGEENSEPHFYIMNADGSDERRFLPFSPKTSTSIEWSPDGEKIAYTKKTGEMSGEIFVANRDGSKEYQLTGNGAYNGSAAFSPDGSQIAYYSQNDTVSALVVCRTDGSEKKLILNRGLNWYPGWSPDGKWLVYTIQSDTSDGKDIDIYAIRAAENEVAVKLVDQATREAEGRWR